MRARNLIFALTALAASWLAMVGVVPLFHWPQESAYAATSEISVQADADTYVNEADPDANYNDRSHMYLDAEPEMQGFLSFGPQDVSGEITNATLQVYAESSQRGGFSVHGIGDADWGEDSLTFNNAPEVDPSTSAESGEVEGGSWVELDVTDLVRADGSLDVALLTGDSTRLKLATREAGETAPSLTIAFEESEGDNGDDSDDSDETGGQPSEHSITPEADAYVSEQHSDRNFGDRSFLYIDGEPALQGYMRFNLGELDGDVTSATLRVHAQSSHSLGYSVHASSDNAWVEDDVTYNNAPGFESDPLGESGGVSRGDWTEFDVTSVLQGEDEVTFALVTGDQTRLKLASRESGDTSPVLDIEVDGDGSDSSPDDGDGSDGDDSDGGNGDDGGDSDPGDSDDQSSLEFPIRATFYYPWFPSAWDQGGMEPYTQFTPSLGEYDSSDPETINSHVDMMENAQIDAGIASWWGQGHHTDEALGSIMDLDHDGFKWSIYHEEEGHEDLSQDEIRDDLTYIRDQYASDSDYLRVDDKFVVFVYNADDASCDVVDRWVPVAEELGVYLSLKVFSGYEDCANQPDAWHQYGPATAASHHQDSYNISPGFYHADEGEPRLERDLDRWKQNVQDMVNSGEPWQLITSFNEWGEGTIVEESEEFGTDYLDVLAENGTGDSGSEPDDGDDSNSGDDGDGGDSGDDSDDGTGDSGGDGSYTALIAASDIAYEGDNDERSAEMIDSLLEEYPDLHIQTAGDNVQGDAEWEEYDEWYDDSWGRFLDRTQAAIGNHDYLDEGEGENYHRYFGDERGGPMDKFYYSYDLPNNWHVVVINANNQLHEWEPGTEQYEWLKADLEANKGKNILASWHQPRYTSGYTDDYDRMSDIWTLLDEYNAEFVVSGHTHLYERYQPQDGDGNVKSDGVVQFGVGTASSPRDITSLDDNAEVVIEETQGLTLFRLYDDHYEWEFIPLDPNDESDSGSAPIIP